MKQLSGLDTAFIHQESQKTPMHVSPVLIYGPRKKSDSALHLDDIERAFSASLSHSAILTQKLLSLPLGMDEPYWVTDKKFSLSNHLGECELPSPGNWTALKNLMSQLHGKGLNLKKPLWHATLITGLDNIEGIPAGSSALMLKIHHAAIDGISLALLVAALHEESDDGVTRPEAIHQTDPNEFDMWNRAGLKQWTRPFKLASTVSKLLPAVAKLRDLKKPAEMRSSTKHTKTRFNREVTVGRVVGALKVSLDDLKTIRRGVRRVTLNDIAISIVGGALRDYLESHGELPKNSLVCGAPVNLRGKNDGTTGNKIATMQVGLATDIEDPVDRLRAVHQYALMGKAKINTLGSGTVMDISDSVAPGVLAEGLRALSFASTRVSEMPVPFHVMISNVPGPAERVFLQDAPLHSLLGLGPIRHSMGLFHVVSNAADNYTITFTSCRSIMPDPDTYERHLRSNFDALLAAAKSLL